MENKKTKSKNFLNSWGFLIILNLIVIIAFAALFIESAYWKEVPYNARHITDDLPTYLIYFRTIIGIFLGLYLVLVNTSYIVTHLSDKKSKEDTTTDSRQ